MTIHSENIVQEEEENISIQGWGDLPDLSDVTDLMPMCSSIIGDHADRDECLVAIAMFMNQFLAWHKVLLGNQATVEEMENIMSGESIVLDMTNDWFRRSKPLLEPMIMQCKSCLTVVRVLKVIGKTDQSRLEEEIELVWSQFVRMWDFIPWFVFMCTGSTASFIGMRLLMSRYCTTAKPHFIEDYRVLRGG